jgi:hypothetical protein
MTLPVTLLILFLSALLEASGDALIRSALHAPAFMSRMLLFALGGVVLFAYGRTVNAPPWDFGRLLGIYVVFFFLIAQAISWLAFHQKPNVGVWVGGAFIVFGGVIISIVSSN